MKIFYKTLLQAVAALIFGATATASEKPNFIVILCDDLGWGDLSSYGHPHISTPNLDKLAEEGIRFTNAYSAAPVCSPSRVGLLTGRNPNRSGVFDWIPAVGEPSATRESRHLVHLRKEEVTLPALLKKGGYSTALCGKWHCNSHFNSSEQPQPDDAGFDHWFSTQNNASPSHENPVNFIRNGSAVGPLKGFSCQLVAEEAIAWMEKKTASGPEQPFYLQITFHEPHEPVASPKELVASYGDSARNENEAQYFANVSNLDAAVGNIVSSLDRLGLSDNTLVFFTSDNGPETLDRYPGTSRSYGSAGHLRGMKLWTTEAGTRVPAIIRWPDRITPGKVSDVPISSLDLLPTFCSLAGADVPETLVMDGVRLDPLFHGGRIMRTKPLFWIYYDAANEQRAALRDGPWKLLARFDHGKLPKARNVTESTLARFRAAELTDFSLYHLGKDPQEARDLALEKPGKVAELADKLRAIHTDMVETMHVWPDQAHPAK